MSLKENSMIQKLTFLKSEGDQWFLRNKLREDCPFAEKELRVWKDYINEGDNVLEIGCADGRKLDAFSKIKGINCFGIDPSSKAVKEGNQFFTNINLKVGTADEINTHKYDYGKIFESVPFYHVAEKLSYSHKSDFFSKLPSERISTTVLYKDYENSYCEEKDE